MIHDLTNFIQDRLFIIVTIIILVQTMRLDRKTRR